MKLQQKHRDFCLCVLMTLLIAGYLLWFEILPTRQEVFSLKTQNAALKAKVTAAKITLNTQEQNLSTHEFYRWFSTQNFAGVKLLHLMDDQQAVQVSLSGSISSLMLFLQAVQNSQFSLFSLTHLQDQAAQLELNFESLQVSVLPPVTPVVSRQQMSKPPSITLLGIAHRQGIKFCVLEIRGKLHLQQDGKC